MSLESSSTSTLNDSTTAQTAAAVDQKPKSGSMSAAKPFSRRSNISPDFDAKVSMIRKKKKNPFDKQDIELDYYADLIRKPARSKSIFKKINLYERVNLMNQNNIEQHKNRRISATEKAKKQLYNQINYYNSIIHRSSVAKAAAAAAEAEKLRARRESAEKERLDRQRNHSISKSVKLVLAAKPSDNLTHLRSSITSAFSVTTNNNSFILDKSASASASAKRFPHLYDTGGGGGGEIETDYVIDDYDESAFENENAMTNRTMSTQSTSRRLFDTSVKHRKQYLRDLDRRTKEFIEQLDKFKLNDDWPSDECKQQQEESSFLESSSSTSLLAMKQRTTTTRVTRPKTVKIVDSSGNHSDYRHPDDNNKIRSKSSSSTINNRSKNQMSKTLYDLYAIPSEVMLANNLSTELGEILPPRNNINKRIMNQQKS